MITANDRKVLCQLLGNLDIVAPVDDRTLHKLHLFLSNLQQVKFFVFCYKALLMDINSNVLLMTHHWIGHSRGLGIEYTSYFSLALKTWM